VRGPWLTSVFGLALLIGIPIEFLTGLLSYAPYNPRLAGNDPNPDHGKLGFYLFNWVTSPSWLYRVTEGTHIMLGLALVPIVLAKLWSVIPKLFAWPPWRLIAQLLERLSLILVVGGVIFEMTTGILSSSLASSRTCSSNFLRWCGRCGRGGSGPSSGPDSPTPGRQPLSTTWCRPTRRHRRFPGAVCSPLSVALPLLTADLPIACTPTV
jgi:hypothetical protein